RAGDRVGAGARVVGRVARGDVHRRGRAGRDDDDAGVLRASCDGGAMTETLITATALFPLRSATPTSGGATGSSWPVFPRADDALARWGRLAPTRDAASGQPSGRRTTSAALCAVGGRWAARRPRAGA